MQPSAHSESDLAFARLNDWIRISEWIYIAVYSGAYDCVARGLWFLIEDVTQTVFMIGRSLTHYMKEEDK